MTTFRQIKREPKRVVIVDDSRTMQALLEQMLAIRMGFEIVGIASEGNSALAMIRQLRPDLVTIDLQMPYIDGAQLLEELSAFPTMHKVVISSHACNRLSVKARLEQLGADACLDKAELSRDPKAFCDALMAVVLKPKAEVEKGVTPLGRAGHAIGQACYTPAMLLGGHPIPFDEYDRLKLLETLELANDDVDPQLDLLTRHLQNTTSFSACVMTFIDKRTQWIKSGQGLDRGNAARSEAICNYTICQDDPFIVPDTRLDHRFRHIAAVLGGPMIRSYVGCPIVSSSGVRFGSICLLDTQPRTVTAAELTNLRSIARIAAEILENRRPLEKKAA